MAGWSLTGSGSGNVDQNRGSNTTGKSTTTQNQSQTTRSRQESASYSQNMTPSSLAALDALIAQLQDRPAISDAELDAKLPLPQQRVVTSSTKTGGYGGAVSPTRSYQWYDPLTGQDIPEAEAQRLMTERKGKRDQLQQEAGIIRGGTSGMQANQVARDQTISNLIQGQEDYDKESAFNDAQLLMDQFLREFGENNIAAITRASEGAGTSASSVRALLMNDAQARAAEAAGALGVKTAVEYGGVSANFANILKGLTDSDPATDALLQALGVAKGSVQSGVNVTNAAQTVNTSGTSTVESSQNSLEEIIRKASSPKANLDYANYSAAEQGVIY